MHLRNTLVLLSTLALISRTADAQAPDPSSDAAVIDAAVSLGGGLDGGGLDASAPEAGSPDAATAPQDAAAAADGGKITHPGAGEENEAVLDEYSDDHGCSCSTTDRRHRAGEGLSSLALAAALVLRARRRRREAEQPHEPPRAAR